MRQPKKHHSVKARLNANHAKAQKSYIKHKDKINEQWCQLYCQQHPLPEEEVLIPSTTVATAPNPGQYWVKISQKVPAQLQAIVGPCAKILFSLFSRIYNLTTHNADQTIPSPQYMLKFYTTQELTNHFLVTKLHIGGFVVQNVINNLLDAARHGIRRPPTSPELRQVLEFLNSHTHFRHDNLQLFWRLVLTAPVPSIVHQVSAIEFQTEQQTEQLLKRP
ncbi:hypothetical protein EST38_g6845 [Candolleomyces aberdarensis]|uniref:Uncharacterized protein n=1 Tax=Candolleomyces aberdarensis TaxID=2316362 RepID=A0A4Q2DIV5_9AGAR|nr:hypothetical protein EST38_g6845 [Candolleomyces aberdarensis]